MDLASQERIGCDWALSASYVVLRLILLLPHEDSWIVDQALALVQQEGVKSLELLFFQRWLNFVPAVRPMSHDVHRRRWDVQAVLLVINGGFWAIFKHSLRRGWWNADDPLDGANGVHAVILLTCWKLIVLALVEDRYFLGDHDWVVITLVSALRQLVADPIHRIECRCIDWLVAVALRCCVE